MTDREKVIRAVETCFDSWIDKHRYKGLDLHEVERMKHDALELLQEPEPVPVEVHKKAEWHCRYVSCPECGTEWMADAYRTHYCPNCGRRVFWEVNADG